jgi:Ca2+-binding EF-hand superfamily protein
VNQSGSLSRDELVDNLFRVGMPITYGQARHLVRFLDEDNSDQIEYVELDDALKHVRNPVPLQRKEALAEPILSSPRMPVSVPSTQEAVLQWE